MTFTERAAALIQKISPTIKIMLPVALLTLLLDMCKALDQLNQEKKQP